MPISPRVVMWDVMTSWAEIAAEVGLSQAEAVRFWRVTEVRKKWSSRRWRALSLACREFHSSSLTDRRRSREHKGLRLSSKRFSRPWDRMRRPVVLNLEDGVIAENVSACRRWSGGVVGDGAVGVGVGS